MEEILPDGCTIANLERQLDMREEQEAALQQQRSVLSSQLHEQRQRCAQEAYQVQLRQLESLLSGDALSAETASASRSQRSQAAGPPRRGAAQPRQDAVATGSRSATPKSSSVTLKRLPSSAHLPTQASRRPQSVWESPSGSATPPAEERRPVASRRRGAPEVKGTMPCLRGKGVVRRSTEPAATCRRPSGCSAPKAFTGDTDMTRSADTPERSHFILPVQPCGEMPTVVGFDNAIAPDMVSAHGDIHPDRCDEPESSECVAQ